MGRRYGLQGALKFGLFELFKREGTPYVGEDFVRRFPTLYYLAASGAAEVVRARQGAGARSSDGHVLDA